MRLDNKVTLITGAGSGIGRATALLFASEGAQVMVSDVDEDAALVTADMVRKSGGTVGISIGDVTEEGTAARIVQQTITQFSQLHVLVNSAGITARNLPSDSKPFDVWRRVIDVNLNGTYLMCWSAVPEMERAGGGSILNLGSIMSHVGYPPQFRSGFNPYPVSKGAILQLTRNLANDLASRNIRVNCLAPGFIETNLTESLRKDPETLTFLQSRHPMGRLGKPEEIAHAALYLVSDDASFVTGTSLAVDGGYLAQ